MRLMVMIPDALTALLEKGEVQPRYYNPGDLFDEVLIVTTAIDQPAIDALQPMVGRARLTVHSIPEDGTIMLQDDRATRWRLLERWAEPAVALAREFRPAIVRCHGADFNAVLARAITKALRVPTVISLHTNPDQSPCRRPPTCSPQQQHINRAWEDLERTCLNDCQLILPVYGAVLPYLKRLRVTGQVDICHNVLDGAALRRKTDYRLGRPARLVWVSRLYHEKCPDNILRALADLPDCQLTVIGDGPLRQPMESLAAELAIDGRVTFSGAVPNARLCRDLADFDVFVAHSDAWECSKSVIEALLTGLPVVINRRIGQPVPEFTAGMVRLVDNTADGYWRALFDLLADSDQRATLGRAAAAYADQYFAPTVTEARYVEMYRRFLQN